MPEREACEEASRAGPRRAPFPRLATRSSDAAKRLRSDALRGDRHRAREIGLRLFRARLDLGIHGLARLRRIRLASAPIAFGNCRYRLS